MKALCALLWYMKALCAPLQQRPGSDLGLRSFGLACLSALVGCSSSEALTFGIMVAELYYCPFGG